MTSGRTWVEQWAVSTADMMAGKTAVLTVRRWVEMTADDSVGHWAHWTVELKVENSAAYWAGQMVVAKVAWMVAQTADRTGSCWAE